MDQAEAKKIPELPDNGNDFWKEAEKEIIPSRPPVTCAMGEHEFKRRGGEAICGCGTGYPLGAGADVFEGHIYIYGTKLI